MRGEFSLHSLVLPGVVDARDNGLNQSLMNVIRAALSWCALDIHPLRDRISPLFPTVSSGLSEIIESWQKTLPVAQ
jgi:hypothetical protein